MPRAARVVVPGLSHHITGRGNNRQDIFFSDRDRARYLDMLAGNCERFGLRVEAYCLMTNHVHLIGVPQTARSLELAVGRTHQRYARYVNRIHERSGHLWEDRFYSCPLDELHRARALRYAERNPERAGLVACAWHYPWSSAAAHCGETPPHRVLEDLTDWFSDHEPEHWREALGIPLGHDQLREVRRQTVAGRPLGSDAFIARIEARLGRRLRSNPVGRPRRGCAERL